MKIHITKIYNQLGTQGIAQAKVAEVAHEMGFLEMGLYRYSNINESDQELGSRIDGIISSLQWGDIVFIQSPSWNGLRYDLRFIRKIKAYKDVKIGIIVHDVVPLAFNSGSDKLRATIDIYNYADVIIVPSKEMLDLLRQNGLTVKRQMIQKIWDYPISTELNYPKYSKRIYFTGAPSRFPFVQEWKYKTPMVLYTGVACSTEGLNIELRPYQKETKLLLDLSEGGFGLVWPSDEANEYYQLLQPYKVGSYLAAGIPVIVNKGIAPENTITENGLGFAVDTLEEADEIVQNMTEEEYNKMVKRISEFNFLIKDGWFTKKLLTDAVNYLLDDTF